jgi:hypothetical protein
MSLHVLNLCRHGQQVGDLEVSYWKEISHSTVSITYAQKQKTHSSSLLNEMNIIEKPNQAECQLCKPIIDILRSGGAYQNCNNKPLWSLGGGLSNVSMKSWKPFVRGLSGNCLLGDSVKTATTNQVARAVLPGSFGSMYIRLQQQVTLKCVQLSQQLAHPPPLTPTLMWD